MFTNYIISFLVNFGVPEKISRPLANPIMVILLIFVSILLMKICKFLLLKWIRALIVKSRNKWDDILLVNNIPQRISLLIPPIIILSLQAYLIPPRNVHLINFITLICKIYITSVTVLVISSILASVKHIYDDIDSTGQAPVKSILQMIKLITFIIAAIVIISLLIKQSPWTLLKAMGAMAAIGMLVFKDPILGLVAGIQLSAQKMLRIGDWIEMPSYGANGNVIDVSLTTVKVQNFDKTVICVPTYALVSGSFQNWRGMEESGGRRIKRSILLDINSFKFLSNQEINELKKIELLKKYLDDKETEISKHNNKHKIAENPINGRNLTNVGTYRQYIKAFLANHSKIHSDMTFIVRQLQPTEKGLPLEIYVFTTDTDWVKYEEIQADIFDHLLTILPSFKLTVFQYPTALTSLIK